MPTNRYSLADYQITVTVPAPVGNNNAYQQILQRAGIKTGTSITIGGSGEGEGKYGSYLGSINVTRTTNLWSTEGDPTGSWVHNKNLDKSGTVAVEITQVSDQIIQLVYLCTAYENVTDAIEGLHLEIKNTASGQNIVDAIDCYIQKVPDLPLQDVAQKMTFTFTCGRVIYL